MKLRRGRSAGGGSSRPQATDQRSALEAAEQLLASLPTILIGLTPELRVTRWNQMAAGIFERSAQDVCGRLFAATAIQWDWERVLRSIERCRLEHGTVKVEELAFTRPCGTEGVLGLTINPVGWEKERLVGFTIIGADITERKALEKQLAQSQKLRSIGQLAAGIAHEINTPTQYVGDNVRFMHDGFRDIVTVLESAADLLDAVRGGRETSGPARRLEEARAAADLDYLVSEVPVAIEHTLEGIERISTIVRALKEFAHPGQDEKSAADLNAIITTTITVARNEWKYVAEMVTDLDRSLPPVFCHAPEIGQVVLNLIINAAQAIEDAARQGRAGKGSITVRTRRLEGWAEIQISDTGNGIPEGIRQRIFDPFFTTKEIGRGTGQGLAICYPVIVDHHGGRISFDSEVGRGTVFTLHLPLGAQAGAQ